MISPAVPAPVVAAPKLQTPGGAPPTAALFQMDQRKVRSAGALGTLSPLFFCSSVRHIFAARLPLNAAALVLLKVPLSLSLTEPAPKLVLKRSVEFSLFSLVSEFQNRILSLLPALSSPSPFSLTFRRSRGQRSRIRSVQKQAEQQKEKEKLREKTSVSVYSLPLTDSVSVPSTAAAVAVAVLSVVACRSSTPLPKSAAAAVAVVDSCRTHDADTQKPRSPELG